MNRIATALAFAAAAVAGSAYADDITVDNSQFVSQKTRAEVRADYIASRNEVNAFTGEDSGSAYLQASNGRVFNGSTTLAGTPVNAQ